MIFLLGATGYVGNAFRLELLRRNIPFQAITRAKLDYSDFATFVAALKAERPDFVINAAGFTGKPNVDACEIQRAETIWGNIVLTQTVAEACAATGTRFGYVSSGCIYTGTKVEAPDGSLTICPDLNAPELEPLLTARSPRIRGFAEGDAPNFTFEQNNCSFYSGTKAVAERVMAHFPEGYVWRLRIPFDEQDQPRNYLTKIQRYAKVYQNWNSISHLADFVSACLQTWLLDLPGGIYNITNPGYASTREIVRLVQQKIRSDWHPEFWKDDREFYQVAAKAPRSNSLLDVSKLVAAGVKIRGIEEALEDALMNWKPAR